MKKVSVIIPFHDSFSDLQKCLSALGQQTYPADYFDIIAVDNGSSENCSNIRSAFPRVQWLMEPRPGSYIARNKGLQHAQGDIVAFTDADCRPTPTWLQEAVTALEVMPATIIGGRIDYLNPIDRELNVYELFEKEFFLLDKQKYLIERVGVAATANVVAYRSVFDRVGLFDSDLMSFGDGEWLKRATSAGEVLRYADLAVVHHPRRSTFQGVFRKAKRLAGGRMALLKKQNRGFRKFIADIYRYSVLSPRVQRYALLFPNVRGLPQRFRMFFLVESVSLANTAEKIRVLLGASSYRG